MILRWRDVPFAERSIVGKCVGMWYIVWHTFCFLYLHRKTRHACVPPSSIGRIVAKTFERGWKRVDEMWIGSFMFETVTFSPAWQNFCYITLLNLLSHKSRSTRLRVRLDSATTATKATASREALPSDHNMIRCNLINLFQRKSHPCDARGNVAPLSLWRTLIM